MPYLSHPVRRIREEPIEGEEVTLLVRTDGDQTELAEQLASVGTVVDRLRFGTVKVRVDHEQVDEICSIEDISAVETTNTLEYNADGAGEDVDFGQ